MPGLFSPAPGPRAATLSNKALRQNTILGAESNTFLR